MLEKIFIATFILTLLVGSAFGLVVITEKDTVGVQENTAPPPSQFKIRSVGDNNAVDTSSEDDEFNHLRNLIRKLRKDIKAIPAVIAPSY